MPPVAALACCSGFVIVALLVFGALLFRISITLANWFLGTTPAKPGRFDDEELDEWIGYRQLKNPTTRGEEGIPETNLGKGMLCVFLILLFELLPGIPMQYLCGAHDGDSSDREEMVFAHLLGMIIGFLPTAWVVATILPTRFGRACLVLVLNYLILMALAVGIFAFFFILAI